MVVFVAIAHVFGTAIVSVDLYLIRNLQNADRKIVVHTPDATLVARKDDEESIRKIVKLMEERGWQQYM